MCTIDIIIIINFDFDLEFKIKLAKGNLHNIPIENTLGIGEIKMGFPKMRGWRNNCWI